IFVLVFDGLKGFAACAWLAVLISRIFAAPPGQEVYVRLVAGLAVVLGHNYTCWLHFKGGKGIATSAAVLAGVVPTALLLIPGLWFAFFGLTCYWSVGCLGGSCPSPFRPSVAP